MNLKESKISDWQFSALILSILIYAIWGSPTPDILGWPEIVTACLLIFACWDSAFKILIYNRHNPLWYCAGQITFGFLLLSGIAMSLLNGNDVTDTARDMAALVFLFLPLFMFGLFRNKPERLQVLFGAVIILALIFSLRSFDIFYGALFNLSFQSDPLLYLSNSPSIVFASIFLFLQSWIYFTQSRFTPKNIVLTLFCFVLAILPLVAILLTIQRASLVLLLLSLFTFALLSLKDRPTKSIITIIFICISVAILWPLWKEIINAFHFKNRLVGDNMRYEELSAIWSVITQNPLSLFFGIGLGGNFASPAVGDYIVNFAHGLLSATLKSGLLGLGVLCMYLFFLARQLFLLKLNQVTLFLSLLPPLIICTFLYASYKSFDFGLILALIAFSQTQFMERERNSH